ncbi:hypothetical protein ACFVOK_29720 [Streptomyces sp. NPDC057798]
MERWRWAWREGGRQALRPSAPGKPPRRRSGHGWSSRTKPPSR